MKDMKGSNYYKYQIRKAGRFWSRLFRGFVSGFPRDEKLIKTGTSEFRPSKRLYFKDETGTSVYHPAARFRFKKSELSKEKKKEKSH